MLNEDNMHYDMLIALRQIIRCTDLHSKKLVKRYGLTGPQLILLQAIANEGDIALGNLAKKISLSQATVTNIVERLEQRGFLLRKKTENDRRRVVVSATEDALEILNQKPSLLDEGFTSRLKELDNWEQNLILSIMQRIAHMMAEPNSGLEPAFLPVLYENSRLKDVLLDV